MNYVLAVVTGFNAGAEEVTLKARGRALSRAVDVAEVVKRRFLEGVEIGKIAIGSEEIEEENRTRTVSTMEITLIHSKPKPKAKAKPKQQSSS